MTVQSNKTLGAVGASLTLTGIVSTVISIYEQTSGASASLAFVGITAVISLLAFIGGILLLVAMYGFSKDYSKNRIFTYLIYAIIIAIVSGVIIVVVWFSFTLASIVGQASSASSPPSSAQIQTLITPYTAALLPALALTTFIPLFFVYRSFNLLAQKSGVTLFRSAARIFVLAAVSNLVLGAVIAVLAYTGGLHYQTLLLAFTPGAFIQYIAWGFTAKGFFSIQPPAAPPTTVQPYPSSQVQYCPNCGNQTMLGDVYCVRCGKKL